MQWLYPAGAWALLSLAAITALYLLRRRSRSVTVPSLLLWQRAAAEQQAMRPFQKLKRNVLYVLQMLLALLLAIALMRPAVRGGMRGETVMIFDLSASMQAVEGGQSRLAASRRKALSLIDGLGEGDRVTVLAAGSRVDTLLSRSADLARARSVIEGLSAGNGGADLDAAVSLAQAMARDVEGLNILVFSDTYPGESGVQVLRAGAGAENRALLSLSVNGEGMAFARMANYGDAARLTLECASDGALTDVAVVELAAGETRSALLHALPDAQTVSVRIVEEDALLADNTRWWTARGRQSWRAALCGENVFVEKAVALREDVALLRTTAEESAQLSDIDLYIFDGALPAALPAQGALLCFAPAGPVLGIVPGAEKSAPGALREAIGAEQITQNLLLEDVALRAYTPLSGGEPILYWGEDAVLALSQAEGRRAAVLGLDVHDSNLPMKGDFPVLMQNLLAWLLPDARQTLADGVCGRPVPLPRDSRAEGVSVTLPSGRTLAAESLLEDTGEQGVYTVTYRYAGGGERPVRFALHMDSAESDVRTVAPAEGGAVRMQTHRADGRELTVWVLLAFLALMLVEWGVSRRVG